MTTAVRSKAELRTLAGQGSELAAAVGGHGRVAEARAVIAWAADTFGARLVVTSSMADEVLVHLAADVAPGVEVVFLDTGYHFAETIGMRDFSATLPIKLINVVPVQSVAEQDAEYGPRLYERDPDACCALRKVEPLNRSLAGREAWVTGLRRADAPTRADIAIVGYDERRELVKVNPLAAWADADIDSYLVEHGVLVHPLRQLGYQSIGCEPCTRPVAPGADPRSGRWAGLGKTECGLHT